MKTLKPIVVLAVTAGLLGGLLAVVAHFTTPVIEANRVQAEAHEVRELTALANALVPELRAAGLINDDCEPQALVSITTTRGYGGEMRVLAAFVGEELVGVRIASHRETPGFADVLEPSNWLGSFSSQPLDEIDTVSRATITTKAVLAAAQQLAAEQAGTSRACSENF